MTAMLPGIRGERRMFLMTQDKSFGHLRNSLSTMASDLAYSFIFTLVGNAVSVGKSS